MAGKQTFDVRLGLEGVHVLCTGGTGLIGRGVVEAFLAAGSRVTVIDIADPTALDTGNASLLYLKGSITDDLEPLFEQAEASFGVVQCCVALASLDLSVLQQSESLCDMEQKTWQRVFDVNINGTFNTCRQWLRGIRKASSDPTEAQKLTNVSCIIMGSEAGRFGVRTQAAYAAGKAAVQYGLLPSLAQDAPRVYRHARVNAIAPGAVDTERFRQEVKEYGEEWRWKEYEATTPLAKPISVEHVARTILFLASDRYSGSIHGQLLPIDAGKVGSVVWAQGELAASS